MAKSGFRIFLAAVASALVVGAVDLDAARDGAFQTSVKVGLSEALAQPARRGARRTARRTTRRTAARHSYYNSLPRGCVWRPPYHHCGGIYYQPQVVDGRTVYIIVNP